MTKDKITARLDKLTKERDQLVASITMYDGAIQDCQHWLKELEDGSSPESDQHSEPTE